MPFDHLNVLNTIADQGPISLHSHRDVDTAIRVADAIHTGGGELLEFMNRTQAAPTVFEQLRRHAGRHLPNLRLGAGSVEDPATAAIFISAGADFIVSPGFVPETAQLCNRHKVAYLPGTMTITEVIETEKLGVEYVKLYPATTPSLVQAIHMARPWTRVVATGDIHIDNLRSWFVAGASAVGTMSIAPPALVAEGHYSHITDNVSAALREISEVRPR